MEQLESEDFRNDCLDRPYITCYQGDVHIHDPCDDSYTLQEQCAKPNGECVDDDEGNAYCKCRNHWQGAQCDRCPDRWSSDKGDCDRCIDGLGDNDDDDDCLTCVRYVNQNVESDSSNTGYSWETALTSIQEAIDAAAKESACEIWVAEGRYHIYSSSSEDTLKMQKNVAVYGGFSGNEVSREERDWTRHKTILDGQAKTNSASRVYHVVSGAENTVLSGFFVTNGRADAAEGLHAKGGGLISEKFSVTIEDCEFTNNYAEDAGGAIYVGKAGFVKVINTTFEENHAHSGGAVYVTESHAWITGSLFRQNKALDVSNEPGSGGAVSLILLINLSRPSKIVNCGFKGNEASGLGAALYLSDSEIEVTHCSFTDNKSGRANGGGAINHIGSSELSITNSILWGDSPDEIVVDSEGLSTVDIRSSDVEGIAEYAGNFDLDPQFMSEDLSLTPFSPCIDRADGTNAPETDIDSNPRCDHPGYSNYFDCSTSSGLCFEFADIGAYEFCSL